MDFFLGERIFLNLKGERIRNRLWFYLFSLRMATHFSFFKGRDGSTEKSFRFTLARAPECSLWMWGRGRRGGGEGGARMNRGTRGDPIEWHDDNETIFDGLGAHKPNNSIPGAEAVGREKIATANIAYRVTGRFRGWNIALNLPPSLFQ